MTRCTSGMIEKYAKEQGGCYEKNTGFTEALSALLL